MIHCGDCRYFHITDPMHGAGYCYWGGDEKLTFDPCSNGRGEHLCFKAIEEEIRSDLELLEARQDEYIRKMLRQKYKPGDRVRVKKAGWSYRATVVKMEDESPDSKIIVRHEGGGYFRVDPKDIAARIVKVGDPI